MSKRASLILILIFLTASCTIAIQHVKADSQAPPVQWSKTYGCLNGVSVIETADRGYLVEGTNATYSSSSGGGYVNNTAILVKTDASGSQIWLKSYAVFNDSNARTYAIQTIDGGYVVAGSTAQNYGYGPVGQFCLMKVDSDGNTLWTKIFSDDQNTEYVDSLAQTSDGGYVLAGNILFLRYPPNNGFLIKTDSEGNMLWNMTYRASTSGDDYFWSVIQTADGGLAMVGTSSSVNSIWLVKTDSQGVTQWQKFYQPENVTAYLRTYSPGVGARSGIETGDGGYMLVGSQDWSSVPTNSLSPAWAITTDSSGNEIWNKTYQTDIKCFFYDVAQTADGGYIFSGASTNSLASLWLVRTDEVGNVKWNMTFPASLNPLGKSVVQASDGGYVVVGTTQNGIWLTKIAFENPGSSLSPTPTTSPSSTLSPSPSIPELGYCAVAVLVILVTVVIVLIPKKFLGSDSSFFSRKSHVRRRR